VKAAWSSEVKVGGENMEGNLESIKNKKRRGKHVG